MECLLATVAFIVFVVISAYSEHRRRNQEINRRYRVYNQPAPTAVIRQDLGDQRFRALQSSFGRFAENVHGQLVKGKFTGSPRVIYHHRGTRVMLSVHDTELSASEFQPGTTRLSTRLTFKVPRTWPLRMELFPQDEAVDLKLLKIYDIEIGVPEFDARYVIKANDAEFLKEFLDEPTRQAVDAVYGMPPFVSVYLSLNRERLVISKPSLIHDVPLLVDFARTASRLYDRIEFFLDKLSGLEIVVAAPGEDESAVCTVCGADIVDRRVTCRRCATPLHRERWDYNGKCAVFGCGETRYAA
jgi:hypothetical protein